MAANTSPIFGLTANVGRVSLSVANTARDGTGSVVTVLTSGANGTRLEQVAVKATATTTSGMVRLFIHDGSAFYLAEEISVSAITPTASVQTFVGFASTISGKILPTGYTLRASTHNGETFHVVAYGEDF